MRREGREDGLSRREFLKAAAGTAAGLGLAGMLGTLGGGALAQEASGGAVPRRTLGRTGLKVGSVGFGYAALQYGNSRPMPVPQEDATAMVGTALDLGMNLFDTTWSYGKGRNEGSLGAALGGRRKEAVISSRAPHPPKGSIMERVEESLRRLKTDYVDIYGPYNIHSDNALERAMLDVPALEKAKEQGKIRFIGASGHGSAESMRKFIESGVPDVVLIPANVVRREFFEEVLPVALKHNVGTVIMKAYGYGAFFPTPEGLGGKIGTTTGEVVRNGLEFLLEYPISTVIIGYEFPSEVEGCAAVATGFRGLDAGRKSALRVGAEGSVKNACRCCKTCLPCPDKINIPQVCRLYVNAVRYGLRDYARAAYRSKVKVKASACSRCKRCDERCHFNLPVMETVLTAHRVLEG